MFCFGVVVCGFDFYGFLSIFWLDYYFILIKKPILCVCILASRGIKAQAGDCKREWLWIRFPLRKIKYFNFSLSLILRNRQNADDGSGLMGTEYFKTSLLGTFAYPALPAAFSE